MEKLWYDIGEVLGVTILHSLWQGLIIYCIVRFALICFPAASSARKYQLLFVSLVGLTVWFGCTFFNEAKSYQWSASQAIQYTPGQRQPILDQNTLITNQPTARGFRDSATQVIKTGLPYLSAIYMAIFLVNIVRFTISWQKIGGVKNGAEPDDTWQEIANRFAAQLAIVKYVQLGLSKAVDGPCTVGYLKPVILLPVAFAAQLSTQEVEAILLHELAHIKNNDYLYNIIQQMMVVILFLNPFALLICRMIGHERENRCDDLVVEMTENPLPYARALVKLEEIRYSNMQMALAATGQKYHLLARVERIIKRKKPIVNIKHLLAILLLFVFGLGSLAWLNPEIKNGKLVSVRGAKAITKLSAIVKNVITKNEEPIVSVKPAVINPKTDSLQSATNQTPVDTILTDQQRDGLLNEYRRVAKDLDEQRNMVQNLPESKQLKIAQHILDSVRHVMAKEKLTPDLVQQEKEKSELFRKYFSSPGYKQLKEKYNAAIAKFFEVLNRQPEISAYNTIYFKQVDSIYTTLQQQTGLSKSDVSKTPEFLLWGKEATIKRDALQMKMLAISEVRAANDSLESARHMLNYDPEFEEVNKKTKASDEYMAAIDPTTGLELYRKAVKEAADKLHTTSASKKMDVDIKKFDDIVDKLYGRKTKQQ